MLTMNRQDLLNSPDYWLEGIILNAYKKVGINIKDPKDQTITLKEFIEKCLNKGYIPEVTFIKLEEKL